MQLELNGLGLTDGDILDLKYMINLRYLNLDDNNLTDLSPVSGLTDLEQLSVNKNPDLTDLSPLAGLTGLRKKYSIVVDFQLGQLRHIGRKGEVQLLHAWTHLQAELRKHAGTGHA